MSIRYFTSESVTEGHPDKVCDAIADRILDELIKQDPYSRCACEVTAESGNVHIMGEITSKAHVDYEKTAREVIRNIGYTKKEYGFDDTCTITSSIHEQSSDIALGVDQSLEGKEQEEDMLGAGDQGMMFGYACNETKDYMPMALHLAHGLTRRLTEVRKKGIIPYLRPDGKAQVTVEYDNEKILRVDNIIVSAQHDADVSIERLREDIFLHVIEPIIPKHLYDDNTSIYINPTGRFVLGGPAADTGLTGRKIIVDTYGGYAHHGGGAFSGKDATKVDRSASYMARYIAKNIVAAELAERCEVQLSYAIGVAQPTSLTVNTYGTGIIHDDIVKNLVEKVFDLTPSGIIKALNLRVPIYSYTTNYGHFGDKDKQLPWECLDKTSLLKNLADSHVGEQPCCINKH